MTQIESAVTRGTPAGTPGGLDRVPAVVFPHMAGTPGRDWLRRVVNRLRCLVRSSGGSRPSVRGSAAGAAPRRGAGPQRRLAPPAWARTASATDAEGEVRLALSRLP